MVEFTDNMLVIYSKALDELKHVVKLYDRIITGVIYYHITTENVNISYSEAIEIENRLIKELGYVVRNH